MFFCTIIEQDQCDMNLKDFRNLLCEKLKIEEKLKFLIVYFNTILNEQPSSRKIHIKRLVSDITELKNKVLKSELMLYPVRIEGKKKIEDF